MSLEEFLAWKDRQPLRHQFDDYRAIAMSGGSLAHSTIQTNLAVSIGGRVRGKPRRFHGSDLKIEVAG